MLFGGGGGGRRKGPDAHVAIEVSLEELYNGGERSARYGRLSLLSFVSVCLR